MTEPKRTRPSEPARADPASPARPMAKATRITLFEREVRERLSPTALDLIFARAQIISEGQRERRAGRDVYVGSTMLTVDLPCLAPLLRDACDAATARRLVSLLQADTGLPARIRRIATCEAERMSKATAKHVDAEVQIHCQGAKVFLDIDVEAAL